MRVMVIGATGLIGSSIAQYYLERDETVVEIINLPKGNLPYELEPKLDDKLNRSLKDLGEFDE